jgi:hypothetical protein
MSTGRSSFSGLVNSRLKNLSEKPLLFSPNDTHINHHALFIFADLTVPSKFTNLFGTLKIINCTEVRGILRNNICAVPDDERYLRVNNVPNSVGHSRIKGGDPIETCRNFQRLRNVNVQMFTGTFKVREGKSHIIHLH